MSFPAPSAPTPPMITAQDRGGASHRSVPPAGRMPAARLSPRALDDGNFARRMLRDVLLDSLALAKDFLRAGQNEHAEVQITNAEQAFAQLDQLNSTPETILEA